MQINNQISNQNFGMAIHSDAGVKKLLKSRIKNAAQLEKLKSIVDRQSKNDLVDIQLFVHPNGKNLTANVFDVKNDEGTFFKHYSENILTKLAHGPIGFIEKLAKIADKEAAKISKINSLNFDDVFKNMK